MNEQELLGVCTKAAEMMNSNDIEFPSHAWLNGQWYRQIEGDKYEKIDDPNVVVMEEKK